MCATYTNYLQKSTDTYVNICIYMLVCTALCSKQSPSVEKYNFKDIFVFGCAMVHLNYV